MVSLSSDRPIIGQGPPLFARLFFLGVISIVIMVFDHKSHYLDSARDWLTASLIPLNSAIKAPMRLWDWASGSFVDREALQSENAELREKLRVANSQLLRFDSMVEENRRLRALREASKGITQRTLIADIMQVDIDPIRHRVLIDKGVDQEVYKGQPVLDDNGILGQVERAGQFTSEVILITDAAHAIPVQINRNGVRSIAVGTGDPTKLTLPFLTTEVDIRTNDLLVTSGLGGVFPSGYPVARVTKVERNPSDTFATVEAKPLAALDRSQEVLLLWNDQANSKPSANAAPVSYGAAARAEAAAAAAAVEAKAPAAPRTAPGNTTGAQPTPAAVKPTAANAPEAPAGTDAAPAAAAETTPANPTLPPPEPSVEGTAAPDQAR